MHLNDIIVAIIFQYKQKFVLKINQCVLSSDYMLSINDVELISMRLRLWAEASAFHMTVDLPLV